MENFIIIAVLVVILGAAIGYIVKAKKRGEKCIGCPYAKKCCKKIDCCDKNAKDKI
jgi:hypothetical protein